MRPWIVIAGWAALLALWTAVQLLFSPDAITLLLLGGASLAVLGLALLVSRGARRSAGEPGELSPATPTLAVGAATMASGAELGTWCILLGALIVAAGFWALIAEARR